jgi:hypothetical protein
MSGSLTTAAVSPLWIEPRSDTNSPMFTLRSPERSIASLTADGLVRRLEPAPKVTWRFVGRGVIQRRIEVLSATGEVIGTYRPKWSGGGRLSLDGHGYFDWSATNLRRSRWRWSSADAEPALGFDVYRQVGRLVARVETPAGTELTDELIVLIMLGAYLRLCGAQPTDDSIYAAIFGGTAGCS